MHLTAYILPTVGLLALIVTMPIGNSVSIAEIMALRGVGYINSKTLSIVDKDTHLVHVEASNSTTNICLIKCQLIAPVNRVKKYPSILRLLIWLSLNTTLLDSLHSALNI